MPFRGHVTAGNPVAILAGELIKLVPVEGSANTAVGSLHRRSRHDLDKVAIISNPDFQERIDVVGTSPTEDPEKDHQWFSIQSLDS